MSTTESARRLLKRLPLHDGESVVSFLQRHCEANAVSRMQHLLKVVSRQSGERVVQAEKLVRSQAALRAVEELTGLEPGGLNKRYNHACLEDHVLVLRQADRTWRGHIRIGSRQAVCPLCIRESGYAREAWEFPQAPVCVVHGIALIEHCPRCAVPLAYARARLKHCQSCGFSLAAAPICEVPRAAVQMAALVQAPRIAAMGDPHSTGPIDEGDVSKLLRLSTLPRLGQNLDHGLTEAPDQLTVSERVCALDVLGSAFDGKRVDTRTLRRCLVRRWPYAEPMADVIQRALLADAAKRIRLMPATSRLLCHDDDGFQVPSAATVFKGRPPSLTSDQAVATFLGIDVDLYWKLLAMTGQWPLGAGGMGADMDQVLKLQRELAAVMPLSQVDALLGGPAGLAEELVRADLLLIFKSDDRVLGVHPAGLLHLLGGIHGRIHPQPDANSVALVSVQAIREDALFAAKAIARIHGGSLGALGWQSPFRLLDVLVDGSQLQMEVLAP